MAAKLLNVVTILIKLFVIKINFQALNSLKISGKTAIKLS